MRARFAAQINSDQVPANAFSINSAMHIRALQRAMKLQFLCGRGILCLKNLCQ
jgi:hypothetical protein